MVPRPSRVSLAPYVNSANGSGRNLRRRSRRRHTFTFHASSHRWKEMVPSRFPKANCASVFSEARKAVVRQGVEQLKYELVGDGFIDSTTDLMTTGKQPFNVFARIASGLLLQDNMLQEQGKLGSLSNRYTVACNRSECDVNWDSTDPAWVGKASMAHGHVFLTVKDLHWEWFNVLTFGLVSGPECGLAKLREMKEAALRWTNATDGWPPPDRVGLFFHVYGHSSVNSCHLHVVNLDKVGPSFAACEHKNLPLDAAIAVLDEEVSKLSQSSSFMD